MALSLIQRAKSALLADRPFPDLPIPAPVERRPFDYVIRLLQVAGARARRRNPGIPPWRQRTIERWHVVGEGPGPLSRADTQTTLCAVIAAWNEDDIIFASVRNLFEQGFDYVFVLDDSSDDNTAAEAAAAGATVSTLASNAIFCEATRSAAIQRLIAERTKSFEGEVWWIIVDADEFPKGPRNKRIRDFVMSSPSWVDVVGSRVLDHWPSEPEAYQPRTDPLFAFPLARWYRWPWCRDGHWKHQLIRLRTPEDLVPMPGHHTVRSQDGRRVREHRHSLLMHHFALRNRQRTSAKLAQSWAPGGRYQRSPDTFTRWRIQQRIRSLENVYNGRFALVPNGFPGEQPTGLDLKPWQELVSRDERIPEG